MNEVKQSMLVPTIRSFLKLYTTIPVAKLAAFLEMDEKSFRLKSTELLYLLTATFRKQLMCFKHKTRGLVWNGGAPLNGTLQPYSDVDFYLDKVLLVDACALLTVDVRIWCTSMTLKLRGNILNFSSDTLTSFTKYSLLLSKVYQHLIN